MGIVAAFHFLVAGLGVLFLFVDFPVVVGEREGDLLAEFAVVLSAGWLVVWGGVGFGLFRRRPGAWVLSLVLVCFLLFTLALSAGRNPLGAICNGMLCAGVLVVLIARRGEFRTHSR